MGWVNLLLSLSKWFSNYCCWKTNTKVITLTNHNRSKQQMNQLEFLATTRNLLKASGNCVFKVWMVLVLLLLVKKPIIIIAITYTLNIPKWPLINYYSFVCMLISPLCLVNMYKKTKEFWGENEAKSANEHANKRIIYWPPFWNKAYRLLLSSVTWKLLCLGWLINDTNFFCLHSSVAMQLLASINKLKEETLRWKQNVCIELVI